ncbi:MAG: hypothetical protein KJ600_01545, partial [Nanoarchaeota archaeon]|nr:hypothetical protein [Nanoarchaeota archaeon]
MEKISGSKRAQHARDFSYSQMRNKKHMKGGTKMKAQIIALSLILMLSLTSVTAQTNFEIEKNIVEFTTIATELPAHYSKSCSYTWDSTSYVGETVKINAMIADSDGKTAEDSVKVEVVDSDISSGGGGGHSMSGD